MLAEPHLTVVPIPSQRELADVVELDSRLRAFSCPTGLHDLCSKTARHDLPIQDGLAG